MMPEMKPTSSVKASNRPMTAGVASTRMSMVVLSKRPVIGAKAQRKRHCYQQGDETER
ncbi:MAG: hypothetical protein ACLTGI_02745 [Hoylesella buccalis]